MIRQFVFESEVNSLTVSETSEPNTCVLIIGDGGQGKGIHITKEDAKQLSSILDGRYSSYGESIRFKDEVGSEELLEDLE